MIYLNYNALVAENIDQNVSVAITRNKLPYDVLLQVKILTLFLTQAFKGCSEQKHSIIINEETVFMLTELTNIRLLYQSLLTLRMNSSSQI